MKDFYEFDSKYLSTAVQASAEDLIKDDHRNNLRKLFRGIYNEINFPVIFSQYDGRKFLDVLNTGKFNLFLISDRFKHILEQGDLTGWKTYKIKLYDKKGNEILGYNGFSIIGRCNSVYYKDNTIFEKQFVPGGPICKFYKGEFFDIDKWDKTDFFMPIDTDEIFVTKKVHDIIKKNKITNTVMKRIIDVEINVSIINRPH